MRPLTDPRLRRSIPNVWPSRVTIQTITYTTTAANQKIPSGATDVATMTNMPCRIGPIIISRPTDDEVRDSQVQERWQRRHLIINQYCPQIVTRRMQAVVDGVVFPIRGVEFDGSKYTTRLRLEVVTP